MQAILHVATFIALQRFVFKPTGATIVKENIPSKLSEFIKKEGLYRGEQELEEIKNFSLATLLRHNCGNHATGNIVAFEMLCARLRIKDYGINVYDKYKMLLHHDLFATLNDNKLMHILKSKHLRRLLRYFLCFEKNYNIFAEKDLAQLGLLFLKDHAMYFKDNCDKICHKCKPYSESKPFLLNKWFSSTACKKSNANLECPVCILKIRHNSEDRVSNMIFFIALYERYKGFRNRQCEDFEGLTSYMINYYSYIQRILVHEKYDNIKALNSKIVLLGSTAHTEKQEEHEEFKREMTLKHAFFKCNEYALMLKDPHGCSTATMYIKNVCREIEHAAEAKTYENLIKFKCMETNTSWYVAMNIIYNAETEKKLIAVDAKIECMNNKLSIKQMWQHLQKYNKKKTISNLKELLELRKTILSNTMVVINKNLNVIRNICMSLKSKIGASIKRVREDPESFVRKGCEISLIFCKNTLHDVETDTNNAEMTCSTCCMENGDPLFFMSNRENVCIISFLIGSSRCIEYLEKLCNDCIQVEKDYTTLDTNDRKFSIIKFEQINNAFQAVITTYFNINNFYVECWVGMDETVADWANLIPYCKKLIAKNVILIKTFRYFKYAQGKYKKCRDAIIKAVKCLSNCIKIIETFPYVRIQAKKSTSESDIIENYDRHCLNLKTSILSQLSHAECLTKQIQNSATNHVTSVKDTKYLSKYISVCFLPDHHSEYEIFMAGVIDNIKKICNSLRTSLADMRMYDSLREYLVLLLSKMSLERSNSYINMRKPYSIGYTLSKGHFLSTCDVEINKYNVINEYLKMYDEDDLDCLFLHKAYIYMGNMIR